MILEVVAAAALVVLGAPLAALAGLPRWGVAALSAVLGGCWYLAVGLAQVVLPVSTSPVITIVVSAVGAAVAAVYGWPRLRTALVPTAVALAAAMGIAVVTHALALMKWTADSMVYLAVGGLLANDRYRDVLAPELALDRLVGVGLLHAPAHLGGAIALVGVTPVLAASALATAVWMLVAGARDRTSPRALAVAVALLVGLSLSANRMVFTAFYINGHVLVGAAVLVLAGAGWLTAAQRSPGRLLMLAALVIPAAVATRPDSAVLIGVVLIGVIAEPRVRPRERTLLVGTLGLATLAWNLRLALMFRAEHTSVPVEALAQVVGGVALLGGAALLLRPLSVEACARIIKWSSIALAVATALAIAIRPTVAVKSVYATVVNLAMRGGWTPFLPLLIVALIAALYLFSLPEARALRFAVLSFPAVALVFAVVRNGAYRVGPGDSLNRSWAHVIPAALLLLVATVLLGRLRRAADLTQDSAR